MPLATKNYFPLRFHKAFSNKAFMASVIQTKNYLIYKCLLALLFILIPTTVLTAQSVGGITNGDTAYCSTTNAGVVHVTGYVGTILNWQSTTDGGNSWNNNLNTTPNQTYFNLNQTTCYRAVVQDGGNPPDTSTVVCVSVFGASVGGTISGGGTFCDSSGSGTLTLTGYSGNIVHWLSSTNNGSSWTTISNITATQNYPNLTQNTIYEAVVQSDSACAADTSTQAVFNISAAGVAGVISGATTVCITSNSGTLHLTGYSGNVQDWETSVDAGGSWQSQTNTSDSLVYVNLNQDTWYRVIVQGGCGSDTTNTVIMSIGAATVLGVITGGGNFCGTPATGTLTLAGYSGSIISWASSTNNGVTWTSISNTTNTYSYTNVPATTAYVAIVQSSACGVDTTSIENVFVAPPTVAGTVASSGTVCNLINSDTLLLTGNTGNVINWLSSTDNGATWTTIANTSTSLEFSGLSQNTQYAAVVQSGTCTADTTTAVTITVSPLPTVSIGSDSTILQGTSIVLNPNGTGSGTALWTPATGLSSTSAFSPLANPSTTTQYILIVKDANNCINADTVLITVLQSKFNGTISNLFTPNGDGLNDTWYIESIASYPDNEVIVYNIYGNEVFRSKAYTNTWKGTYNGKDLPDGTYYYVLLIESLNATIRGSIDILRSK